MSQPTTFLNSFNRSNLELGDHRSFEAVAGTWEDEDLDEVPSSLPSPLSLPIDSNLSLGGGPACASDTAQLGYIESNSLSSLDSTVLAYNKIQGAQPSNFKALGESQSSLLGGTDPVNNKSQGEILSPPTALHTLVAVGALAVALPTSAALTPTVTNTDTTVLLSPSVPPLAGQLGDVVPQSKQDEREFLLNSPFFNDCYLSDSVDSSVSDTEGAGAKFDRIASSTIVSRTVIRSPLHSRVVADVRPSTVGAPLALSFPSGEPNSLPTGLRHQIRNGPLPRHATTVLSTSGLPLTGDQHSLLTGPLREAIYRMCQGPSTETLWKPLRSTPISTELVIGSPTLCGPSLRGWELSLASHFGTWRRISSPHPLAVGLMLGCFEHDAWDHLMERCPSLPPKPPGLKTLCRSIASPISLPGILEVSDLIGELALPQTPPYELRFEGLPLTMVHCPKSVLEPPSADSTDIHLLSHRGVVARLLPRAEQGLTLGELLPSYTPCFKKGDVVLASVGQTQCTGVITAFNRAGHGFLSKFTVSAPVTLSPPQPVCPAVVGRLCFAINFSEPLVPTPSDVGASP